MSKTGIIYKICKILFKCKMIVVSYKKAVKLGGSNAFLT